MMSKAALALVIGLSLVLAPLSGRSQEAAPPQARSSLTPAQAQQALEVLQDDKKRTQLIDTLQAIAKASPDSTARPAGSSPESSNDNLGVQLLVQVSNWVGDLSEQLAVAARAVSDFPMVGRWLVQTATDPDRRYTLFDTAWKLALVIGCALAIEWIARRAIRAPLGAVERYIPERARQRLSYRDAGRNNSQAESADEPRRRHVSLMIALQLILRLPFILARLIIDLIPVTAFAVTGYLLLATELGSNATGRVVIVAMLNAYVLYKVILCVIAALVSPSGMQPSLFTTRDETAAYIDIWAKRVVIVAVFGTTLANIALLLGLYRPAYAAVVRLVVLVAHLLLIIIILQCRRGIADLIRAPANERGAIAVMRNRFADVWHIIAIVLDLGLWAVWALQVQNGYALLLQYIFATIAVLVIARLISIAVMMSLDRVFRISPDFLRQFPGLETRANRYFPVLRITVTAVIAVITVIALLEVWGIDAAAWFSSGQIGGRLVSAVATIAVAVLVALGIWEASNAAIERHLARLAREGRYGRAARLRTFLPMLRTTLLSTILTVVVLTALSELGVNIAPLLAGAGIKTQAAFQTVKGLHGSTYFTLSLPVSRFRLLAIRAGIGHQRGILMPKIPHPRPEPGAAQPAASKARPTAVTWGPERNRPVLSPVSEAGSANHAYRATNDRLPSILAEAVTNAACWSCVGYVLPPPVNLINAYSVSQIGLWNRSYTAWR